MLITCSKDPTHQSTDEDYCSICGAKIAGVSRFSPAAGALPASASTGPVSVEAPAAGSAACPDCGTPRRSGARFCEVCRYNFDMSKPAEPGTPLSGAQIDPLPPASSSSAPPAIRIGGDPASDFLPPTQAAPAQANGAVRDESSATLFAGGAAGAAENASPGPASGAAAAAQASAAAAPISEPGVQTGDKWEAVIMVDPALYVDPDPDVPCPVSDPERVFPIDLSDNLVGRRNARKEIYPQIPLTDPGVSHRHAKLLKQSDGSLALLDVGSTNGTQLNGKDVEAGVRTPLKEGDEITLGCWTRMRICRRGSAT